MAKWNDSIKQADEVEKAVRNAIASIPGINNWMESEYCNALLDGLAPIVEGAEMRSQELKDEDE